MPSTHWPYASGYTFSTWIRLSSLPGVKETAGWPWSTPPPDSSSPGGPSVYTPYIYTFANRVGSAFSAYLESTTEGMFVVLEAPVVNSATTKQDVCRIVRL